VPLKHQSSYLAHAEYPVRRGFSVSPHSSSWPGFVPAIHAFVATAKEDVDARHEAGHDERVDCQRARKLDCFVAVAPLRKRFAFVAGNDEALRTRPCILAARERPRDEQSLSPLKTEGAGKAGCPLHPQPRVRKLESTRA